MDRSGKTEEKVSARYSRVIKTPARFIETIPGKLGRFAIVGGIDAAVDQQRGRLRQHRLVNVARTRCWRGRRNRNLGRRRGRLFRWDRSVRWCFGRERRRGFRWRGSGGWKLGYRDAPRLRFRQA